MLQYTCSYLYIVTLKLDSIMILLTRWLYHRLLAT